MQFFRSCFRERDSPNGEDFYPQTRRFPAAILGGLQGEATQYTDKKTAQAVYNAYENGFSGRNEMKEKGWRPFWAALLAALLVLSGILRYAEARYTAQALTPRLTRLSIPGQAVQESYTAEDGSVVIQKVPNQKYLYYFLLRSSSKDIPLKLTEGKAYGFYDGQLYQLDAQFYIHDTSKGVLPLGYESGVEFSNQVVNGWLNPLPAQGRQLELVMVLDEYPDYLDQPDQFLLELTYQPAGFAASLLPDGDTAPRTVRLWSE